MNIGNYGKKQEEKKELDLSSMPQTQAPSAPATPNKTLVDAVERGLDKDLAETQGVAEKALTYEELLEREGISLADARAMQDALLIDGVYTERVQLTPSTSVTFRSRVYADFIRYHQIVERYNPKYEAERVEIMLRSFLAASLAGYRDKVFSFPDPKDHVAATKAFEERQEFIQSLPETVVAILSDRLNRFDEKLRIVLSEGAVENF